jgi:A/G-specific adenine glycosylase
VLVSEAMLQQTQVATVVDYFQRFVKAFPTVKKLAKADEQQVLGLWQGLGYYRRARHLHAAAKMIVEDYAGNVPDSVDQLLKLPGVGRYTAGAVASIAYDKRAPILDGNVARVLSRLTAIKKPTDDTAVQKMLWSLADQLVPKRHPGDFNQAMMELGALVCLPRKPKCDICPVSKLCMANSQGLAGQLPVRGKQVKVKKVTHHIAAIKRKGKILFEQRPAKGLWSNMWQLPTAEMIQADQLPQWFKEHTRLTLDNWQRVKVFTHQTTHRTIRFELWRVEAAGGRLRPGAGVWRRTDDIKDLPMANPQHKAVAMLEIND